MSARRPQRRLRFHELRWWGGCHRKMPPRWARIDESRPRAGRPRSGLNLRKAKTVPIGKKRFAELKDVDHLHVRVTGGHLRERRVVGHVQRMGKRNRLGALCLRRWRDTEAR